MKYSPEPRQPTLFERTYKYIIDACSVISQNPSPALYPRNIYKGLWEEIDALAKSRKLVTCRQIANEIITGKREDTASRWIKRGNLVILEEGLSVQKTVADVVNATPQLLRFGTMRGSSSGDAFIIATAIEYNLVIITEEKKTSPYKIPQVANRFGVEALSISELAEREGWVFDRVES